MQEDARLIAVHAWTPPGGDLADRNHPSAYLRRLWATAAARRLQDELDGAWGGIPPGLDVEKCVVRGQPGPALVELASGAGDLLVVGAGRRGRLGRIWHGAVSRYCVSRARCPVLTVPPADGGSEAGHRLRWWSFWHRELTVERAIREWESSAG